MVLTLLSKFFGFARDIVLANFYGATNVSDAFFISLTIPELAYSLVAQAIAVGFIPIFIEIMHHEGEDKANDFTNKVLTMAYFFSAFLLIIANLFPKEITSFFARGFDEPTISLTSDFIKITTLSLFLKGTSSVLCSYCQAKGEFTRPALIGLPYDIIIIISIYISYKFNVLFLAYGTVFAYASQIFLTIPYCYKSGYRQKLTFNRHDTNIKKIIALFLPVMLGVGANQINIFVDRMLASTIAVGGISALNYANKIGNVMENIIVLSIASVMYPVFSSSAVKNDYKSLTYHLQVTLDTIMLLIIPITVISIVFAEPIITFLFSRGAFDMNAVELTTSAMIYYSVGMIGVSFRVILTRAFYALRDVKTPVVNATIAVIINVVLNFYLSKYMGIGGLALASSIASLSCSLLMLLELIRRIGFNCQLVILHGIKTFITSGIMGAIIALVYRLLINNEFNYIWALCLSVTLGIIIYIGLALLFQLPGTGIFVKIVRDKLLFLKSIL